MHTQTQYNTHCGSALLLNTHTQHNSIALNSTGCAVPPAAGVSEETDLCTLLPSGDTSLSFGVCEGNGGAGSELNAF